MKKFIKNLGLALLFVLVPLALVLSISFTIRLSLNKYLTINYNNDYTIKSSFSHEKGFDVTRIRYAKANENCFLFKTSDITNSSYDNVLFIVPETYFVTILSEVNSMMTKVQYRNKIGYVSSDSITKVDFVPVTPTLEGITFDIPDDVGTQVWSIPEAEDSSNVIKIIPAGSKNVTYIASVMGAVPTGGSSNVWYYASYTPVSDPTSVYEGYVYSGKTINLTNITTNLESNQEITDTGNSEDDDSLSLEMNDTVKVILIVLICVPVVLVFVLLIVGNKRNKKNKILDQNLANQINGGEKADKADVDKLDEELGKNRTLSDKSIRQKKKTIKELEGKTMYKKDSYFAKFVSSEAKGDTPVFPAYEVVDDDDLL